MTKKPEPHRRRGTPISDSLGDDLHALGSILANHTRGLDDYLQRQAGRIEERHGHLLSESAEILLPPGPDLNTLTAGELQNICRQQRLRGWSKLRRNQLITFLKESLGTELEAPTIPERPYPRDANRIERLLLLLLQKLGTATEVINDAWQGPGDQTADQPASVSTLER
ncbi:hypothetical protein [Synechococcus sp. UW140]|uniref:hypothetical protein n=1 Tax=Synechococcus sp. UW140 TaxID=368503 RepID=UPI003137EE51